MRKTILSNGIKVLYEKSVGNITSFTIGFEAGGTMDPVSKPGLAHAVEHMVFKGTYTKSEGDINTLCNKYLGFHNAMTNYPYVVYYGSCLKEDFSKAFEVYSDIVLNPSFKEDGFKEEMGSILEELKEWKDDVTQCCEDFLFYNCFKKRRIKELIIGTEDSVRGFTLENIKDFYNNYYTPDNCVISIVTSLEYEQVMTEINRYFMIFSGERKHKEVIYEDPMEGVYIDENYSINGCKLQYIFPIHQLNHREITLLRFFNEYFSQGTSSILYDELRTKRGLIYDILGNIKNESGIKLYSLTLGTSQENLNHVKAIINSSIENAKINLETFDEDFYGKYIKSQNLKRMLELEKSIVLSMRLCVYEIMYGDGELLLSEFYRFKNGSSEEMHNMLHKLFSKGALGVITPKVKL